MIIKEQFLPVMPQKISFQVVSNQHALLMPVGDIHYGTKDFPTNKFIEHFKWGMDRGAVFIGMGEYLDFAPHSQRRITSQLREEIQEQMDEMIKQKMREFYRMIEFTAGRWIGLIEGDHRWDFFDGTSADQFLCGLLNADFLGSSALITLHPAGLPKNHREGETRVYIHHGIGSSRSAGGHLHRVEDLLKWVDCDVALMGHSHSKIGAPIDCQTISPDGVHYHKTKLIARTGSWLKGYQSTGPQPLSSAVSKSRGSYVEGKAYTPSALGGIAIGIGFEQVPHSRYLKPALHFSM